MIVPPESMEQVCRRRGSDRFEDCNVSLRRDVPAENKPSDRPRSGTQQHVERRRPPGSAARAAAGVTQGLPRPQRLSPPGPTHLPRTPGPPRRPSPLDVALVGQEVIEDAEARGGLQVPEAHGGCARPDRHRRGKGARRACAGLI